MNNSKPIYFQRFDSHGFTLTELLVTTALSALVFMTVGISILHFTRANKFSETENYVNNFTTEVLSAFLNGPTCTINLRTMALRPNGPSRTVNKIDLYDKGGSLVKTLLGNGMNDPKLSVSSITVTPKTELSRDILAAEMKIIFTANSPSIGSKDFPRTIGVNLAMANGLVASCINNDTKMAERTCQILSGNTKTYDPISGMCLDKFYEMIVDGDAYSAACPTGWTAAPTNGNINNACTVVVPPGFWTIYNTDPNAPLVQSNYQTGPSSTQNNVPKRITPYLRNLDTSANKCITGYIQYLTTSTNPDYTPFIPQFKTQIKCLQPR